MLWPFEVLEEFFDLFERRQPQIERFDLEWLLSRLLRRREAQAQISVDRLLEGFARAANLFA